VSIQIGGVVPRTITEYWEPIPADIVTIVPAWSAFRVVRIGDEILIIDPNTFESWRMPSSWRYPRKATPAL
jgi:hypothetical protein